MRYEFLYDTSQRFNLYRHCLSLTGIPFFTNNEVAPVYTWQYEMLSRI